MSVRNSSSPRRFITDGKNETSAGIFTSGNYAWVTNGDKLYILDTEGCPRPVYSFGIDTEYPVDITCVEELVLDCTTPIPLLLVGTSSLHQSQLCVFSPEHSRVIRAIQLDNFQVRCMAVVEDRWSSLNSLTDVLSAMDGVVALGCADGSVVLVDLNHQAIVKAYLENTDSTPQPVKFVSTVNEDTTIVEILHAQESGESSAITLNEEPTDTKSGVTALTLSRETACIYVGYSSGLWQIWNQFSPFAVVFECAECDNPVTNFCQIEPCEDPRPTIYLWVNHEGNECTLKMYMLSYANKRYVPDCGIYYQGFIGLSRSFSMYPKEEIPNITSDRLVSSKAYSSLPYKTIKRQNMGLPEMKSIQKKLVATTFSLTYTHGATHTYLCIFDLDQWYKEQMPHEPNPHVPYIVELASEPLLASSVLIDPISLYDTEEPQQINLVPQALSYRVIGVSETGLMFFDKKLWLVNTEARSLIHPTKLFHACVSAGLVPLFPAHQNTETSVPTDEEMRSYIMSVFLDNGLTNMILEIGEQWKTIEYATSNCLLNFLFEWVSSSVSTAYKSVNGTCDLLFSASGHELDVSVKRRLLSSRLILDRLYYIHSAFCSKYNPTIYKDKLEPRPKEIDIITLFVHQVSWLMSVGLPEANSKALPKTILYDYLKLDRFAVDRRQRLNTLFVEFKTSGESHELPGAGLYLVDHFVHDYNELGQQWEDEGGSNAYPPPSIQSLLRSLHIPTVPTPTKLALLQYTLLDIMGVIDKAKLKDLVLPKINPTKTKVIKGLWHLDHSLFKEGLQYLLDPSVKVSHLSEDLHRAILRMLLFEGKGKLALQYLRLKNPPLSLPDDHKLEMSLLLSNKLTSEAYQFQREHTDLRETLLRQLFSECLVNGNFNQLSLPLDESEINFFQKLLAENQCQSGKEAPSKSPATTPLKSSDPSPGSHLTPQDSDSIKNRLRSRTPPSTKRKDMAVWDEIAEKARAQVLSSRSPLPSKPLPVPLSEEATDRVNEEVENQAESRQSNASIEREVGSRHRKSRASSVGTEKRKGRRSQSSDGKITRENTSKPSASKESSEGPSSEGLSCSSRNRSSTAGSKDGSASEPREKKKHQLEQQSSGGPMSKMPRKSVRPKYPPADSSSSRRPSRSRSLHDYFSERRSKLTSIKEVPEESPRLAHRKPKKSMRASNSLTAIHSLISSTNCIDSNWMAEGRQSPTRASPLPVPKKKGKKP